MTPKQAHAIGVAKHAAKCLKSPLLVMLSFHPDGEIGGNVQLVS